MKRIREIKSMAHVLMSKKGELFEGYRVSFFDKAVNNYKKSGHYLYLGVYEHDGWICFSPEVSQFGWFLNKEGEKHFEDLGEL